MSERQPQTKECVTPVTKRKKNKEKKRLMTLFRAPLVNDSLVRITQNDGTTLKQSLLDIIKHNPYLKLHQKPKIDNKTSKLSDELVIGLNSVIRGIQSSRVIGVILSEWIAIHLRDTIIELCANRSIDCVCVEWFDEIKNSLNISCLTVLAFKPNITSNNAIFREFYNCFRSLVDKNNTNVKNNDFNEEKSVIKDLSESEMTDNDTKSVDNSETSLNFYTKINFDNYSELVRAKYKFVNDVNDARNTDMFRNGAMFVPLAQTSDVYFPMRTVSKNSFYAKIDIPVEVQENERTHEIQFAEALMNVSSLNVHQMQNSECSQKRKINRINYRCPQIVRLEYSTNTNTKPNATHDNRNQTPTNKKLKINAKNKKFKSHNS